MLVLQPLCVRKRHVARSLALPPVPPRGCRPSGRLPRRIHSRGAALTLRTRESSPLSSSPSSFLLHHASVERMRPSTQRGAPNAACWLRTPRIHLVEQSISTTDAQSMPRHTQRANAVPSSLGRSHSESPLVASTRRAVGRTSAPPTTQVLHMVGRNHDARRLTHACRRWFALAEARRPFRAPCRRSRQRRCRLGPVPHAVAVSPPPGRSGGGSHGFGLRDDDSASNTTCRRRARCTTRAREHTAAGVAYMCDTHSCRNVASRNHSPVHFFSSTRMLCLVFAARGGAHGRPVGRRAADAARRDPPCAWSRRRGARAMALGRAHGRPLLAPTPPSHLPSHRSLAPLDASPPSLAPCLMPVAHASRRLAPSLTPPPVSLARLALTNRVASFRERASLERLAHAPLLTG